MDEEVYRRLPAMLEMSTRMGARVFVAHIQREYATMLLSSSSPVPRSLHPEINSVRWSYLLPQSRLTVSSEWNAGGPWPLT